MSTKRPLLNTASDQLLFVPDESRAAARDAALKHRNTLLAGEPGSGKSSVLFHVLSKDVRPPAILVDARLADDSRSLLDMLIVLAEEEGWIEHELPPAREDPLGAARQVRRLRTAPKDALVLLDDPTTEQARTLFGQLRDELWQTPVAFCVTVSPSVMQALSRPPTDAFFDTWLTLEPLAGADAEKLLRQRRHAGQNPVTTAAPSTPLQPRALVALAAGEATARRYDPRFQHDLLRRAEDAAGRAGAMLVSELWTRDAVSASDEDLQRSLGVTRNRLTELLRTLTEADVLQAAQEPAEGRVGRPKMLYSVRLP
jgi:hypothetical protein